MSNNTEHSAWVTYRRLLAFAVPYRGLLAIALIAALIEAAGSGAFAKMMEPITNRTFIAQDLANVWLLPALISAESPAMSPICRWGAQPAVSPVIFG